MRRRSQVKRLINSLKKQQQSIDAVVDNPASYKRSHAIVNLEKSALRKELQSLKAQDWPQLKASLTNVIYDVQNGFDEYEVYGGVDLTMPIYDSGLSSAKKRGIEYKIKIQDDLVIALQKNKSKELGELIKQYHKLQVEYDGSKKKAINLREKLQQIKQKMAVVEQGLLTKLQTQLQLAQVERSLKAHIYSINAISIDYWAINEQLLDKMNIQVK
jgi:outer membrane protein TolC